MLPHIPEFEAGNDFSGMARKHLTGRGDIDRAVAPTADTGLWKTRVIVRHNRVDHDAAMISRTQHFNLTRGVIDLLPRRHQGTAVLQRPAVVLHMGNFHTLCAE